MRRGSVGSNSSGLSPRLFLSMSITLKPPSFRALALLWSCAREQPPLHGHGPWCTRSTFVRQQQELCGALVYCCCPAAGLTSIYCSELRKGQRKNGPFSNSAWLPHKSNTLVWKLSNTPSTAFKLAAQAYIERWVDGAKASRDNVRLLCFAGSHQLLLCEADVDGPPLPFHLRNKTRPMSQAVIVDGESERLDQALPSTRRRKAPPTDV